MNLYCYVIPSILYIAIKGPCESFRNERDHNIEIDRVMKAHGLPTHLKQNMKSYISEGFYLR
jgi:hypothetical protein